MRFSCSVDSIFYFKYWSNVIYYRDYDDKNDDNIDNDNNIDYLLMYYGYSHHILPSNFDNTDDYASNDGYGGDDDND